MATVKIHDCTSIDLNKGYDTHLFFLSLGSNLVGFEPMTALQKLYRYNPIS